MEYIFWYFRKAPDAAKTVSPLRRLVRATSKACILAAKVIFVGILAFIVYKVGMAVAGFNFKVIWSNLPALLFWRFPGGDESEFSWASEVWLVPADGDHLHSGSFIIGLIIGMGRTAKNRALRIPCTLYIEFIRAIPLILVIFWFYTVVLSFILNWSCTPSGAPSP